MMFTITLSAKEYSAPNKSKEKTIYTDTTTNDTYRIKDVVYPVFKSKSGARYIWKKSSKSGKTYKMYLPKNIQIQMGRKYNN